MADRQLTGDSTSVVITARGSCGRLGLWQRVHPHRKALIEGSKLNMVLSHTLRPGDRCGDEA